MRIKLNSSKLEKRIPETVFSLFIAFKSIANKWNQREATVKQAICEYKNLQVFPLMTSSYISPRPLMTAYV